MEPVPNYYLWDSISPLLENDVLMSLPNNGVDYTGDSALLIPLSNSDTRSFDDDMSNIFEGSDESETLGWANSDMDELIDNLEVLPYQEEVPAPVPDPPSVLTAIKEEPPSRSNSPHNSESVPDAIQPCFGQDPISLLTIPAGTQNVPSVAQQHGKIFRLHYEGGEWYWVMEQRGHDFSNDIQQVPALLIPKQEIKQEVVEIVEIKCEKNHSYSAHNASLSSTFPGNSVKANKPTLIAKQDPIPNDLPRVRKRKQVLQPFEEIPTKKQKIKKAAVTLKSPKAAVAPKKPKATVPPMRQNPKATTPTKPKVTANPLKRRGYPKRLYETTEDELKHISDAVYKKRIIRAISTKGFHDHKKGLCNVLEEIVRRMFQTCRCGAISSILNQDPGLFQEFKKYCSHMIYLLE